MMVPKNNMRYFVVQFRNISTRSNRNISTRPRRKFSSSRHNNEWKAVSYMIQGTGVAVGFSLGTLLIGGRVEELEKFRRQVENMIGMTLFLSIFINISLDVLFQRFKVMGLPCEDDLRNHMWPKLRQYRLFGYIERNLSPYYQKMMLPEPRENFVDEEMSWSDIKESFMSLWK